MGMRLNFEVLSNGKCLASGGGRWSAYTGTAMGCIDSAIEFIRSCTFRRIDDYGRIKYELLPHKVANDAIDHLIKDCSLLDWRAESREDVNELRQYRDGEVKIDIGNATIHFDAFSHNTKNEEEEIFEYLGRSSTETLPVIPDIIPIEEWSEYEKIIDESGISGLFRNTDGELLMSVD